MTNDKHRKAAARKAAATNGITLAAQVRAHREATKAMPAATIPAPIAVQLARHLRATGFHLAEVRDLVANEGLIRDGISSIGDRDAKGTGPYAVVDHVLGSIQAALTELWVWAERTAHASGAIPVVPDLFGKDPKQDEVRAILYPQVEGGWCARGGTMPRPGDEHQVAEKNTRSGVRYCLPGAVPSETLSRHAYKKTDAKQVVDGTPAQPVWDAGDDLSRYLSGWMDRAGDSPADLAAALDGLSQLAGNLPEAVSQIADEVTRRAEAGRIAGADTARFAEASTEFRTHFYESAYEGAGNRSPVGSALWSMRKALVGAAAAMTRVEPGGVLTRKFDGQPPAVIREALGGENFAQRQMSKTGNGDHSRADRLVAMLDFVHAGGLPTYNGEQHRAALASSRRQIPAGEQYSTRTTATRRPARVESTDEPDDGNAEQVPEPGRIEHTVVLEDTITGCWRSWTDVSVDDCTVNPIIDGELFARLHNESRVVLTLGATAEALMRTLQAPVGSLHEDGPEWNCLVCHDTDNRDAPTTLLQLQHRAHQVRAAFERRAGLAIGEGLTVLCEGKRGVMVAALALTDRAPESRLVGFEWKPDAGWITVVKQSDDGALEPVKDSGRASLLLNAADRPDLFVATPKLIATEWRPARVAEEIERALRYYC